MATVLITGGTGLVGTSLGQALLQKGYRVIILSRSARPSDPGGVEFAQWDVEQQTIDEAAVAAADYIVHLAGAGVAEKRWTAKRKQEIIDSRVQSSRLIATALQRIPNQVKAVISASAIGWYGPDPVIPNPHPFTETATPATDFLGSTCKLWEDSLLPVEQSGRRVVKLRIGIVLSKNGGALKEFIRPMKMGVAAILGSGKQVISWVHINDLIGMFLFAIESEKMSGPYNAVAPQPVSNKELTITLAKSRKRFYIPLPVPSFVLKIMLGEMSVEVLKSCTVSDEKIQSAGYTCQYKTISEAMAAITA